MWSQLAVPLAGVACGHSSTDVHMLADGIPVDGGPADGAGLPVSGPNYQVVSGNALHVALPSPDYALVSVTQYGATIGLPSGAIYAGGNLDWTPAGDGSQSGLYELVFRDSAGDEVAPWLWVASSAQVCNPAWITSADGLDGQRVIDLATCNQLDSLFAANQIAGNVGDLYDNRDGTHVSLCEAWNPAATNGCPMDHRLFPQHDWMFASGFSGCAAPPSTPQPRVTFGQESCSGTADRLHGIAYTYYVGQSAIDAAYGLYTASNLYAFPTLNDDDFPGGQTTDPAIMADPELLDRSQINIASSPYILGTKEECTHVYGYPTYSIHHASGSDLPFVKLMLAASASLRPDVKRALLTGVDVGGRHVSFLAPVIQMLLRNAHRSVHFDSTAFLGGPAHRSGNIAHYFANGLPQPAYDVSAIVQHGSALTVADIPPLAQLQVVSESFAGGEQLFSSPGSIARSVAYGTARSITVSAGGSFDLAGNTSGFQYEWRVIDSDPSLVSIAVDPSNPAQATLAFQPGSSTDRIDVGVFVRRPGGTYYSVPGMITTYVHP